MLSSLLAGIPQSVSPTTICLAFMRPSSSLNARHETVIVPSRVYSTGGDASVHGKMFMFSEKKVPYEHFP